MKITIGGRYVVRNGSIVTIDDCITVHDGPRKIPCWRGQLDGHKGERITWGMGGKRSPLKGQLHELDIIRDAPRKRKAKADGK